MKVRNLYRVVVGVFSLAAAGAASAAVDPAVTTAITSAQADGLVIAGAITLAIIMIRVSKLIRRA